MFGHPLTTFLLWLAYFALHSLLAADALKALARRRFPFLFRWYRIFYNTIALFIFVWLTGRLLAPAPVFLIAPILPMQVAGGLLFLAGGIIILAAFRLYDTGEFVGWRNPQAGAQLQTSGLNAVVRHPLYTGTLLVVAGLWCIWPSADMTATAAAVLVYLPAGIYWEEKKLIRQFGDAYRNYSQRVKRLIPGVW